MNAQVAHWKRKAGRLEQQSEAQAAAAAIKKDNERCARTHAQQAIAWVSAVLCRCTKSHLAGVVLINPRCCFI